MTSPRPLWDTMYEAYDTSEGPDGPDSWANHHGYAAEIRAVADVVAPNEPEPKVMDFKSFSDFMSAVARWNARREIRAHLLNEADRAKAGEQWLKS